MSRPTRLAVVADRIWTGDSDDAVDGMAVLVDGGGIAGVVPAADIPDGVETLVFAGCTLLPGLIDSHVHYTESAGPACLAAGVTTVRDTGNLPEWILGQRSRNEGPGLYGPRIVCCGYALDGTEGIWKHIIRRHPDEESLRATIREHVSWGVDQIKLYASIDAKLMRAGVDEAHRHGKFVLAHLNSTSAEAATEAGLNEIEHFSRCDVAWRDAAGDEEDRLIDKFLAAGVVMNPTIMVWDRLGRALDSMFLNDSRRRWVHPELLRIWGQFPYLTCEPASRLRFQKVVPLIKRFFLRCHQRGVVIIAGTDTPFLNLIPGFGLHDELSHYVDTGLRPVDALRAATVTNAKVIGLEGRVGRIKSGFDADMVAVKGNPLKRIADLGNVETVILRGQPLKPAQLEEAFRKFSANPMRDPMITDLADYVSGQLPTYSQKSGD